MSGNSKIPELLAPAGSYEALRAALAAGADAVYFGGSAFSNRMRARNFADGELSDAIKLCHSCGAKAHITVNTRVRGNEWDDLAKLLETILGSADNDSNADAIICADFGVAEYIKQTCPSATLHASTQTSLCSLSDCKELHRLGFSRIVLPRELSYEEIKIITADSPVETEIFVHGAHCVSLSGQCLLSAMIGDGRSGNRGECAQPCRLPYTFTSVRDGIEGKETTREILSLADMCLAGDVTKIIDSGTDSLKIEGRMKPAGYVFGVTAIYRRLLDERRDADESERKQLAELFSRGFTDGYFAHKYIGSGMSCAKTGDKAETEIDAAAVRKGLGERAAKENERRKSAGRDIKAFLKVKRGEPAELTLTVKNVSRETIASAATGDVPSDAQGGSLTIAIAARSLTKLGGTGFALAQSDIDAEIDDDLWLSAASLNSLRRDAIESLSVKVTEIESELAETAKNYIPPIKFTSNQTVAKREATCELMQASAKTLTERAEELSDYARVYTDFLSLPHAVNLLGKDKACLSLPALLPDDGTAREMLENARKLGVTRVMAHTIGQASLCRELGMTSDMSYRANVWGRESLEFFLDLGCATVCVSPELTEDEIAALAADPRVTYLCGRNIPVMHLSRCAICARSICGGTHKGRCPNGMYGGRLSAVHGEYGKCAERTCRTELTDRRGMKLSVLAQPDCTNIIFTRRRCSLTGGHYYI